MNSGQLLVAMDRAADFALVHRRGATEHERENDGAWLFTMSLQQALQEIAPAMANKIALVVPDRLAKPTVS